MAKPPNDYVPDGYEVIYRRYITRGGKKILPPAGQTAWRLVIKSGKPKTTNQTPAEDVPTSE